MKPKTPPSDGDDLDFTKPAPVKPSAPSPQQLETARKEAATGGAELARSGYYIAIARRMGARVAVVTGDEHQQGRRDPATLGHHGGLRRHDLAPRAGRHP